MFFVIAYGIFILSVQLIVFIIEIFVFRPFFTAWPLMAAVAFLISFLFTSISFSTANLILYDKGYLICLCIVVVSVLSSILGFSKYRTKINSLKVKAAQQVDAPEPASPAR